MYSVVSIPTLYPKLHLQAIIIPSNFRQICQFLQGVFDLPSKLRICVDNDALEIAVQHYTTAIPFLRKYGEAVAFSGIKSECDELVQ